MMNSAVLPPALRPGGTIGLVAPSRWPKPEWVAATVETLEKQGYRVVVHAQTSLRDGQLAGDDAARAGAIMAMFLDPAIDAILCARGGMGALRLLDRLDYEAIRRNPKPFVGFSDITTLLQAITKQSGLVTYHGPMAVSFARSENDPCTVADLLAVLGGEAGGLRYPDVDVARGGAAEGVLVGGNMALLQNLIGTPYDWSGEGALLFLEDVDEPLYKIDRTLTHFRLAGKFKGARAVMIGEMVAITDGETGANREGEKPYGKTLQQIVTEHVPPDVPLCFNFPCGHGRYATTLPVGGRARLTLDDDGAALRLFV